MKMNISLFKGQLQMPSDLHLIFCDRNQIGDYVISFHNSIETLEWNLCISPALYTETYQQFIQQYGRTIQLKVSSIIFSKFLFLFEI
jgi:hypothetical protein